MGLEISGLNNSHTATKQAKCSHAATGTDGDKAKRANSASNGTYTVNISEEAKLLNQLQDDVSKGAAIDENKVAQIKAAISDGSYGPNAERIADKMLDMDQLF